ncbi:MAG: DUF6062 family protein [Clostridiales bacterium]|jgi:hypothetical protein|nr:DUF6062 family protein [Clostridiales bacterium]
MKETIYTIPVMDGFIEGGECPFCNMYRKLDRDAVEFALGPSYMEDDVRMETNAVGFCRQHYEKMHGKPNKLGLALLTHTHLQQINKDLAELLREEPPARHLFGRAGGKTADKASEHLDKVEASCFVCRKINSTFERYVDTYFYMWQESSIQDETLKCNGFCLPHFSMLLRVGRQKLSAAAYSNFTTAVVPIQLASLKKLEEDIDWFIQKFDYRNTNEPWKNSKDALPRALLKISSLFVEQE